jgi:hypothetical protein
VMLPSEFPVTGFNLDHVYEPVEIIHCRQGVG